MAGVLSVTTDGQADRETDIQTDRQTGRQADRQTGRQAGRQIGGQTYRQTVNTERHAGRPGHLGWCIECNH